jgi:hypothetical protein
MSATPASLRVIESCYKRRFGSPKTRASRREVPLAAAVVRELKGLYSRSTENSQEALVFSKSQGLPLAADNRRKKDTTNARKRAGLQRIDWHTPLSDAPAHCCIRKEQPLKVAQVQLEHSPVATLYTRQSECTKKRCELCSKSNCSPMFPTWRVAEVSRKSQLVQ